MSWQKFKADQLFDGYEILAGNQVLVTAADGTIECIINENEAGEEIQQLSGILSPGFINCHCHLELSHMKAAIPPGTGLVDFVFSVVTGRHFEEAVILDAIDKAEKEMLLNGIVAVGDICNNNLTIPQKLKGNLRYHNFIEVSGFPPAVALTRFERSKAILDEYRFALGAAHSSFSPHAPYSISPELLQMILAEPGNHLMTMHSQEIEDENELFLHRRGDFLRMFEKMGIDISFFQQSGKSSLQTFLPLLKNLEQLILVHNVATSTEDLEFLNLLTANCGLQTFLCLCPNANLYISNKLPVIDQFIKSNCNIVLGTDSLASNHQLSILEEMRTLKQHNPELGLNALLQWGTSNGAKVLEMDDSLGSFEKGKRPAVLLLQTDLSGVRRLI